MLFSLIMVYFSNVSSEAYFLFIFFLNPFADIFASYLDKHDFLMMMLDFTVIFGKTTFPSLR